MITFSEASSSNIIKDKAYPVRKSDFYYSDNNDYKDTAYYKVCRNCGIIAHTDASICPSCKSNYPGTSREYPYVSQVFTRMKNIRDVLLQAAHGFTDTLIMPNTGTLAGVTI